MRTPTPLKFLPFNKSTMQPLGRCADDNYHLTIQPLVIDSKNVNEDFIDCLDPSELLKLARWHDDMSKKLKLRSAELIKQREHDARLRRSHEEWTRKKKQLLRLMSAQMQDGKNFTQAVQFGARSSGQNEKTCETLLKRFVTSQKKEARQTRKIMVIKYGQAGWTNNEIASELGVHRITVSKDLKEIMQAKFATFKSLSFKQSMP